MSALPPEADIAKRDCNVRFVPKADIQGQTHRASRFGFWSFPLERGRALAGCTPGAASFFTSRAARGVYVDIAARAHRALTLHQYGRCGVVRN